MKHTHLLIIRFSALGDVAMTVPVIWALARQYPDVRITMLSRPVARPFFEQLAPNVAFMEADIKGEYHGMKGLNTLYRRLAAKQFTHVADLHSVLRSEYLRMRFNMGRYRVEHINKHRSMRRQLVAPQKKKVFRPLPTSFQNYLDVLSRLGFPVDTQKYCFRSLFPEETGGQLSLLPPAIGLKGEGEQWIGIAPFAAHQGKIYPTEKMLQVVQQLAETRPQSRIFLFGRGKDEDSTFPLWVQRMPQCIYVGQHLDSMQQELILMSHLDVMVSMDSANMHLASLTATPVVSVWGATHPYTGFMGWQQKTDNAVQVDLPCRPCSIFGKKPCQRGDYACMNNISPEMILEKINRVLTKNQQQQ